METLIQSSGSLRDRSKYETLFYIARRCYVFIFLSYIAFSRLLVAFSIISLDINAKMFVLFAGLGSLVCAYGIIIKGKKLCCIENLLLLAFILVSILSSILNREFGLSDNLKTIIWTSIQFFVVYAISWDMSIEEMKKEFYILAYSLSIIWFLEVGVSLYQFIRQIGYLAIDENGKWMEQGFFNQRLFGIFLDPNYAAVTSVCIFVFSLYCIKNTKYRLVKLFLIVNCLFQFLYIVLSGSRTAEISFLIVTFLLIWDLFHQKLKSKEKKLLMENLLSPVLALLCCTIVFFALDLTKTGMSYLPSLLNKSQSIQQVDLNREDVENSSDISNLRFSIWKGAIEIWSTKPIFGVSPRNFTKYAVTCFPDSFVAHRQYSVHNGYLSLLVCTGIIGLSIMIAFIVLTLRYLWLYIMSKWNTRISDFFIMCFTIFGAIAFSALPLQDIFFTNTLNANIFWLFLGYLSRIVLFDKEKSSHMKKAKKQACISQ